MATSTFVVLLNDAADPRFRNLIDQWYSKHYEFSEMIFFIQDDDIPETIAKRLGIKGEESIAPGVVLKLEGSYAGFTARALWDWFKWVEKHDEHY